MVFFKKVLKGIGKVFRKIGRGLKKIAAKFGKFMGKIGIIGQIGLSLLLPGIGTMLGNLAGSMINTTLGGIAGAVVKGAGAVLNTAVNIGTKVGSTFKTITEGVTKVMGEVATVGLDKLGLSDSTFGKYLANKGFTGDIGGAFTDAVSGVKASVGDLFSSDTLTGLNKYATESLQTEALGMSREEYLESIPESLAETERDKVLSSVPESLSADQFVDKGLAEQLSYKPPTYESLLGTPQVPSGVPTTNVTSYAEATSSSFLKDPKKAFGEFTDKILEETTGTKVGGKVSEAVTSGFQSAAKTSVLNTLGVETRPVQNITSISGYVPTIDLSGSTDIRSPDFQLNFNPLEYMANNSEFNLYPYGQNAAIYNYGQQYKRNMAQYGFGV